MAWIVKGMWMDEMPRFWEWGTYFLCGSAKNTYLSFWGVAVVNAVSIFMLSYPVDTESGVCRVRIFRDWRNFLLNGREWCLYGSLGLELVTANLGLTSTPQVLTQWKQIWSHVTTNWSSTSRRYPPSSGHCVWVGRDAVFCSSKTYVLSWGISRAIKQKRIWLVHRLYWPVPDLTDAVRFLAVNTELPPSTQQHVFFNGIGVVALMPVNCSFHCYSWLTLECPEQNKF